MAAATDTRAGPIGRQGWGLWLPALLLLNVATVTSAKPVPRYSLLPPGRNETFLIQFNPPSIDRLKVHFSQSVYFNCTQIKRRLQQRANNAAFSATHIDVENNGIINSGGDDDNDNDDSSRRNKEEESGIKGHGSTNITTTTLTTTATSTSAGNNSSTDSSNVTTTTAAWGHRQPSYWVMIFSSDDNIAKPVSGSNVVHLPSYSSSSLADDRQHQQHVDTGHGGSYHDETAATTTTTTTAGGGEGGGGRAKRSSSGGGASQSRASSYLLMEVWEGQEHNFTIQALHVGRVTMSVALVGKEAALLADNGQLPYNNVVQAVATSQLPVTTMRGQRTADLVFDSSAAAIAILITFGIGCCTDTESVKKQLKFPVSLIIGFCCQFILMPVLAFGLAMILPLDKDIRFGLLCTACVPGGGLGHIAVIIGDADIPLSLTMNLISVVAMLGTAPLWIFVLGQYFQSDTNAILSPRNIPIYNFEIWFASIFLAYATGLVVNHFRPVVADMLLTWVIKPFLLLATILYITVGVYINMYVFELINNYAVLGAILLPLIGCLLGCSLTALCRQKATFVKTIALETSSLNCLIVLAALRFSLKQSEADLASMIPIWVMFTIPGLYVALAILQRIYRTIYHYWSMRRQNSSSSKDSPSHSKDYDVASAIVSRPGIAALSAPLVVADGVDDDPGHNEKVTVL